MWTLVSVKASRPVAQTTYFKQLTNLLTQGLKFLAHGPLFAHKAPKGGPQLDVTVM